MLCNDLLKPSSDERSWLTPILLVMLTATLQMKMARSPSWFVLQLMMLRAITNSMRRPIF